MTDDQRQSRGALEGGTPGLASVHDLFSGRSAGSGKAGGGKTSGGKTSGGKTSKNASGKGSAGESGNVVSLDGSTLNQHDLRDMIAQKEAEWRDSEEARVRREVEEAAESRKPDAARGSSAGTWLTGLAPTEPAPAEPEPTRPAPSRSPRTSRQTGEPERPARSESRTGASRGGRTRTSPSSFESDPADLPTWAGGSKNARGTENARGSEPDDGDEPGFDPPNPADSRAFGRGGRRSDGERPRQGLSRRKREAPGDDGERSRKSESRPRPPADPEEEAREILLKQLSAGPRTRSQLAKVLAQKEIPDEVAAAVLDRFEEVDLVDDAAFSQQYVENRHSGRGLAKRALAYELRQKGVADETVREAVDTLSSDDELSTARQLVRKKAASMTKDDPERRLRRLAGMLARKGYGAGVAYQAIREELADLDAEGMFGHPDFD